MGRPVNDRTFLSPGAENLLTLLHPHRGTIGTGAFPSNWTRRLSCAYSDSPSNWFVQSLNSLSSDPAVCKIDESIAAFGLSSWRDGVELDYACVHIIVAVDSTIDDLYCDPSLPCHYFRMEADASQPGPLFKEAFPHIHVRLDGEPRFGLGAKCRTHVLQEFIEFIYRNYRHEEWMVWARHAYEVHKCCTPDELYLFDRLSDAYNTGDRDSLRLLRSASSNIRDAIALELAEACALRISHSERTLIDYP